jgi:hypothetical protein
MLFQRQRTNNILYRRFFKVLTATYAVQVTAVLSKLGDLKAYIDVGLLATVYCQLHFISSLGCYISDVDKKIKLLGLSEVTW